MNAQPSLFDAVESRRRRDETLDRLEQQRFVDKVRRLAAQALAGGLSYVTTDDLHGCLELPPGVHPSTWGSVLKMPYFEPMDSYEQTKRPSGHARRIRRWRLGPKWERYA